MKVLVVASLAFSLVNFRKALLERLVAEGHDVVACAPEHDPDTELQLASLGVAYRQIPMQRAALSPVADLATLISIVRLIRKERAHIVLAYTQKPIIYAGLASQLFPAVRFYAMVSGLGYLFGDHLSYGRSLLRGAVSRLYRLAVRRARAIFVFNRDDRAEMLRRGIIRVDQTVVQVAGSGINLDHFPLVPVPSGPPVFLMVARLLREKGVIEFAEAARSVRARFPDARFQLLGPPDPSPAGLRLEEVLEWQRNGVVEYLGVTRDVRPYLARATVFVLPTWYREGLPRTILEALATGRAVITTDSPGCREAVVDEVNGCLVRPRNLGSLAGAMLRLATNPELVREMGLRSRHYAETLFDVDRVNDVILESMGVNQGDAGRIAPAPFALGSR